MRPSRRQGAGADFAQHIRTLNAARLAADVEGVSTILLCRTDSHAAQLLTTDVDERDRPFLTGERTPEGFFRIKQDCGVDYAIARSLAYAPYADLLWWETSEPNLEEAERFANEIHKQFPGKMLAYNCSPSFNWKKKLSPEKIADFQKSIGAMGYKFQFVTLAGFHSLNYSMFQLASGYKDRGMAAYSELQQAEFAAEADGYTATRHQREVGTGWFDAVATTAAGRRLLDDRYGGKHGDRPVPRQGDRRREAAGRSPHARSLGAGVNRGQGTRVKPGPIAFQWNLDREDSISACLMARPTTPSGSVMPAVYAPHLP